MCVYQKKKFLLVLVVTVLAVFQNDQTKEIKRERDN